MILKSVRHTKLTDHCARCGLLDILKYAHQCGCKLTYSVCHIAAFKGYLECLKYACENGCELNSDITEGNTCTYAIFEGHLDCLRYAYEHGCPIHIEYCRIFLKGDMGKYVESLHLEK